MEIMMGDRRADRRYQLRLPMRYRLLRGRRVLHEGTAYTSDVGRGGLSFDAGRFLPSGLAVEISIDWPVLLRGDESIQLRISGRITRSDGREVAVKSTWHDFVRTVAETTVLRPYAEVDSSAEPVLTM
jgi:hypothetical protein